MSKQLTSVILPNSVTAIGPNAFQDNKIVSVVLGNSLTSIAGYAFFSNYLQTVSLPPSVQAIHACAFGGQLPAVSGRSFYSEAYSGDTTRSAAAINSLRFVQLTTADLANVSNLTSNACIVGDEYDFGDLNNDGQVTPLVYAGHIINPATVTVNYRDSQGKVLLADSTPAGTYADGSAIQSYKLTDAPAIPLPSDPYYTSPTEQIAITQALTAYYTAGQNVTLTPPAVPGYVTPKPVTLTLAAGNNTHTFTYQTQITSVNLTTLTPPPAIDQLLAKGTFSIDSAKDCTHISTSQLLAPNTFNAPTGQRTLGGIDFTLTCATAGGSAVATVTLGGVVTNATSSVHVYKKNATGQVADITKHVTITQAGNVLSLAYGLTDGATFDDDNTVNSSINDPVYVTVDVDATSTLASTGTSVFLLAIFAVVAMAGDVVALRKARA